jgi:GNAT superfamily N-acetyltransferase
MTSTPVIRPAAAGDRKDVAALIYNYLLCMREKGSEVIPSDRTLSFFTEVFDLYLEGDEEGVVLVAVSPGGSLVGITMAGHTIPFDTIYGKTATGWLTFVTPEARGHGTGTHLRGALRSALRDLGYSAIAAGYHMWNDDSRRFVEQRGFRSLQVYGVETLEPEQELEAP